MLGKCLETMKIMNVSYNIYLSMRERLTFTTSIDKYPDKLPEPYLIANSVPFALYVLDFLLLYL